MAQSLECEVLRDPNPTLSSIAILDSRSGASVLIGSYEEGHALAARIEREARKLWPAPQDAAR